MHISHKGYTLAETLVTILIIGVLSAVTLPILQKAAGNKLETMRIKCMYILEQTVSQMLADDVMYPQSNSSPSIGLANTKEITFNGVKYEGNTKFCELFASRINKMHNSVTNCRANEKSFTSADGVDWYLPIANFSTKQKIKFDVNGENEDPNCTYNETTCPKPDIFEYYISPLGKITEEL